MKEKIKTIATLIVIFLICIVQLKFIYFMIEYKFLHQDAATCNQIRDNMFYVSSDRAIYYKTTVYYNKYRSENNLDSLSKYISIMDSMYIHDKILPYIKK